MILRHLNGVVSHSGLVHAILALSFLICKRLRHISDLRMMKAEVGARVELHLVLVEAKHSLLISLVLIRRKERLLMPRARHAPAHLLRLGLPIRSLPLCH